MEGPAHALLLELERVLTVVPGVIVEAVQWSRRAPPAGPARLVTVRRGGLRSQLGK
jgi:hypothetical protein